MVVRLMRSYGEVYLPGMLTEAAQADAPIRVFGPPDLARGSQIFDCIRRGGIAVLSGPWDRLEGVLEYARKRRRELIRDGDSARNRSQPRRGRRNWERERHHALARLVVLAEGDRLVGVEPEMVFPHLLGLLRERERANEGRPFLFPLVFARALQTALTDRYPLAELGGGIFVPDRVLAPVSSESVALMAEALASVKEEIPAGAEVLDMGTGSGCLALLAARILGDRISRIVATDLLPEAVAAANINVARFALEGSTKPGLIELTEGGDLFAPVGNRCFGLIIFNAPWVVSPAKSRGEQATHDQGQSTLGRFLSEASGHLDPSGRVLLQYSDHSGPKAVEGLTSLLRANRWVVRREWRARVQARRKSPRWETVFILELYPEPYPGNQGGAHA